MHCDLGRKRKYVLSEKITKRDETNQGSNEVHRGRVRMVRLSKGSRLNGGVELRRELFNSKTRQRGGGGGGGRRNLQAEKMVCNINQTDGGR